MANSFNQLPLSMPFYRCPGGEGKGYRQLFVSGKMQGSVCSNISHRKKGSLTQFLLVFFFFPKFVGFLSNAKFGKTAVILALVKHALSKVVERKFHTFQLLNVPIQDWKSQGNQIIQTRISLISSDELSRAGHLSSSLLVKQNFTPGFRNSPCLENAISTTG